MEQLDETRLTAAAYLSEESSYLLYDDDGISKDYENPDNYETITVSPDGTVRCSGNKGRILKAKVFVPAED